MSDRASLNVCLRVDVVEFNRGFIIQQFDNASYNRAVTPKTKVDRCDAKRCGVDPRRHVKHAEALLRFENEPLRQFYTKAVCGGLIIPPADGRPPIEAPLAFQSAMAGILLAAELVADAGALRGASATKTILDMTRPLASRLGVRVLKPPPSSGPRCICQDQDFIAVYREKHRISENV